MQLMPAAVSFPDQSDFATGTGVTVVGPIPFPFAHRTPAGVASPTAGKPPHRLALRIPGASSATWIPPNAKYAYGTRLPPPAGNWVTPTAMTRSPACQPTGHSTTVDDEKRST